MKYNLELGEEIESLDDLADLFFNIARDLRHPIKNLDIELTKSWGEQDKKKVRANE